ncbi:hypothetical protein AB0M87_31770 [Streptomyces sp. NPDC051320]|uniref:hypothetical protein n=1 Tax=Streptomyces sp. NPDC051320 TaxID=3154644 RepID=UPI00344A5355
MNRRPALLAAVVLTTVAALSLSACGGGDKTSKDSDKIAGADVGQGTTASPSSNPSHPAGRPKIVFATGAKNIFEDQKTGDAKRDAVLADNAQRIDSVDDAIFKGSVNTNALSFYSANGALDSARTFVKGYVDDNRTWTGTTRYFDRTVTLKDDGTATVVYCSDESKSFLRNRKTGKVEKTPTTSESYVLYNTKLVKDPQGVWQTTNVISKRGADQCQP